MNSKMLILGVVFLIGIAAVYYVTNAQFDIQKVGGLAFLFILIPTLVNPIIGFTIIIISMLFSPDMLFGFTTRREVSIRIEDVFLGTVVIASFLRATFRKDFREIFRSRMTRPYLTWVLAGILSSLAAAMYGSIDLKHSFLCILKYFEYFLLFITVKINLKSLKQAKYFVVLFLLVAAIVSIHSNAFIEEKISEGVTFFRTAPPVETRNPGESGTLGGYLMFMLSIAIGLLLYMRSPVIRGVLIILILLMFRAFLYTLSRGSYVAIVAMIAAMVVFSRKPTFLYITSFCAILLVVFAPPMVKYRISSSLIPREAYEGRYYELEGSPKERVVSWQKIMEQAFPARPIFGYGVGLYFVDGQIFTTLVESGILGLSALIWLWVSLFKRIKEKFIIELANKRDFGSGLALGCLAGFIGLIVQALSTNTFIIIRIMEPFWFITAIVVSLSELPYDEGAVISSHKEQEPAYNA